MADSSLSLCFLSLCSDLGSSTTSPCQGHWSHGNGSQQHWCRYVCATSHEMCVGVFKKCWKESVPYTIVCNTAAGFAPSVWLYLFACLVYWVSKSTSLGLKCWGICTLTLVDHFDPSDAFVADEVITSRAGVRVRIGNTDAEGRMAMADLLCQMKERVSHYCWSLLCVRFAYQLTISVCKYRMRVYVPGCVGMSVCFSKWALY